MYPFTYIDNTPWNGGVTIRVEEVPRESTEPPLERIRPREYVVTFGPIILPRITAYQRTGATEVIIHFPVPGGIKGTQNKETVELWNLVRRTVDKLYWQAEETHAREVVERARSMQGRATA